MASIFDLEFQGRSLQNYMGILLWNYALLAELSKTSSFSATHYPDIMHVPTVHATLLEPFGIFTLMFIHSVFCFILCMLLLLVTIWWLLIRVYLWIDPWRYMRDFEIETIGLKETARRCSKVGCGARLRDTVLDWEVMINSIVFNNKVLGSELLFIVVQWHSIAF